MKPSPWFCRFGVTLPVALVVGLRCGAASTATERVFLSGRDAATAVPWEFRVSSGAKAGEWSTIPVPSNWELHGFGTFSYGRVTPSESGEYRHRFVVPRAWEGRRIKIAFDGVMTDTRVSVNGRLAGPVHQGGFYRFSHDITGLVRYGAENLLEVTAHETSSNEGVNKAERTGDYWNFGGIYRPVWLEALPAQAIERVAIDARADGKLSVDVFVEGDGEATHAVVEVIDRDGRSAGPPLRAAFVGGSRSTRVAGRVESPAQWTVETPNLYRADVSLVDGRGTVVHRTEARFGFRTFEVRRGDGFYLNGQRIILQGANRHSFSATGGRCLSESDHREDIRLMKEMNATAVRMSHYPPDERFLELCDEEGLYVLDELAGWQKSYDTPVGRALVEAMIKRDVNHPSILLWDNGNEGGWNTELDDEFAKWDPQQRPVLHPWQIFNGVNTAHYRLYPQLPALVAGLETAWRYDPNDVPKAHEQPLIYLPTEFLHALYDGGAGAGMEDYWTLMRSGKTFGGGFVWVWMDEGVLRPDTGEIDVRGNLAPDGIVGPRREREASFYTLKELWSPVVVRERTLPADFAGELTLENRFSFTSTRACRFAWELRQLPKPMGLNSAPQSITISHGVAGSPEIAPGGSGVLQLDLPPDWREADVLALRIEDPQGRELWTYTWALPGIERFASRARDETAHADQENAGPAESTSGVVPRLSDPVGAHLDAPASVASNAPTKMTSNRKAAGGMLNEEPQALVLNAGEIAVKCDQTTGALVELSRAGARLSLGRGLRSLAQESTLVSMETRQDGADVVVEARYTGGLRSVEWRIRADGWIDCAYVFAGTEGSTFQGVGFDLPGAEMRAKSWVGDGPYRVWQNRRRGVTLGAWSNAYNETITGWRGFDYPEFKGFFAGVRWLTLETSSGRLTVVPRSDDLFVQVMKPDLPPAELQAKTAMALPSADLGLLHVIPAIGTKFSRPEEMGPQSATPAAKETYAGAFSLRWED